MHSVTVNFDTEVQADHFFGWFFAGSGTNIYVGECQTAEIMARISHFEADLVSRTLIGISPKVMGELECEKYFDFLDELNSSRKIGDYAMVMPLISAFPELNSSSGRTVLMYWMKRKLKNKDKK